jgi:hypothetical protein
VKNGNYELVFFAHELDVAIDGQMGQLLAMDNTKSKVSSFYLKV